MSKMRYDDRELFVIKNTFSENEPLLKLLRKVFLQAKLDKEDINKLGVIYNSADLLFLIKKTYAPEIELDAPLGQIIDLWLTVDSGERTVAQTVLALKVRRRLMDLINLGLARLEKPKEKPSASVVDYEPDFTKDDEALYVEFAARNALITHTEFQLNQLLILAGSKDETPEETKIRLMKNSAK
jgi:hypothetical protein